MKILLVEDDRRVVSFVMKGLEAESYAVDVASNGREGFDLALAGGYDLILLDVMLPVMDGNTICAELRNEGVKTPIIMLTERDTLDDKLLGFGAGADDYLTKPFSFKELLVRIGALLERPAALQLDPVLTVDDLVLDTDSHDVSRGGEPIKLTHTEFILLEYMMRRADRDLNRSVIEDQVWGDTREAPSNIVDLYVKRLRQKVDDGFDNKLIRTVHGTGYRLGS